MKKKVTSVKFIRRFAMCLMALAPLMLTKNNATAQGSTSAGIKGYVFNNSNQALHGATVSVTYLPTNTRFQSPVTEKGAFNLQNLPSGGLMLLKLRRRGIKNIRKKMSAFR